MTISLTDIYTSLSLPSDFLQAPFFSLARAQHVRSHPACDGAHDQNFRDRPMTKASDNPNLESSDDQI